PLHEVIRIPAYGEDGHEELKRQCFDLRIAVFVHEQGFPLEVEIDHEDDRATHFLVRLLPSLTPVGTLRTAASDTTTTETYYKIGRLVVLKEYRQFRFGRALVLKAHEWIQQDAVRNTIATVPTTPNPSSGSSSLRTVRVVSHSQLPVVNFYAKYGYIPEGDIFDEDGAPHRKMVAHLPLS
ncbi:acyl-CoA N-acyltransferase, partial [Schizopora paradoxa]